MIYDFWTWLTVRLQHWHYGKSAFYLTLLHLDFFFFLHYKMITTIYPFTICILLYFKPNLWLSFVFCCRWALSYPDTICWVSRVFPAEMQCHLHHILHSQTWWVFSGLYSSNLSFYSCVVIPNGFSFIVCFITRTSGPFSLHLF